MKKSAQEGIQMIMNQMSQAYKAAKIAQLKAALGAQ